MQHHCCLGNWKEKQVFARLFNPLDKISKTWYLTHGKGRAHLVKQQILHACAGQYNCNRTSRSIKSYIIKIYNQGLATGSPSSWLKKFFNLEVVNYEDRHNSAAKIIRQKPIRHIFLKRIKVLHIYASEEFYWQGLKVPVKIISN